MSLIKLLANLQIIFGLIFISYCKIALQCIFAEFEGGGKWVNNRYFMI